MTTKKDIRNVRISARITNSLYKRAQKFANNKKWTVSDLVEEALIKIVL